MLPIQSARAAEAKTITQIHASSRAASHAVAAIPTKKIAIRAKSTPSALR
jgi:hypothetical protein